MKKITFFLLFVCVSAVLQAQNCKANTEHGTYPATNSGYTETVTTSIVPGEYMTVTNVQSNQYRFTSSLLGVNDYITIRNSSGNTIIYEGTSPVTHTFTAGQIPDNIIQIHVHLNSSCSKTDNGNHTVTLQNLTNAPTCYGPATNSARVSYLSNTRIDFYWSAPSQGNPPVDR